MEQEYRLEGKSLMFYMPKEVDHHVAQTLCTRLDAMIENYGVKELIFDFTQTEFMDSSGIGIIAGRYKKVQCLGGNVYILNAGKQVNRILMLSGIQKYVVFMKD